MRRVLGLVVMAAAALVPTSQPASSAGPATPAKACSQGRLHVVVRGEHVCRPAPDLRVTITGTPTANRAGGLFTYRAIVANRGLRPATGVTVRLEAPAEPVSVTSTVGSCPAPRAELRMTCRIGALAPRTRAVVTVEVRATALGVLRLSARASSPVADARPGDNAARATGRVTPPDSVQGRAVRPSFGTFFRPPVVVEVDAISGPAGHDAAGTLFTAYSPNDIFNPGLEVRGRVVCLAVLGNRATVGAVVEETRNAPPDRPFAPGSGIVLLVTDNGDPGPGQDTMLTYFPAEPPTDCAVPWPRQNAPEIPLSEGNLVVRDESG